MPLIPPDPGKLRVLLDGFRAQLEQLEELAAETGHPLLGTEAAAIRGAVERLEAQIATVGGAAGEVDTAAASKLAGST